VKTIVISDNEVGAMARLWAGQLLPR